MQQKKSLTVDLLKSFAIVLMIFGHCIVYGSGVDNTLGKTRMIHHYIYSFHMPLFALVSGYLFFFTIKRHTMKEVFKTRVEGIIIPLIAWQFLMNVYRIIFYWLRDGKFDLLRLIRGYSYLYGNMWFLWAILFCSLAVMVIHYKFNDNLLLFIVVEILTLLPGKQEHVRFVWLYPYFVLAYLFAKYKERDIVKKMYQKVNNIYGIVILIIIHLLLVYYWKMDYYIYDYGIGRSILMRDNLMYVMLCNLYRFIAGIIGTLVYTLIFSKLKGLISKSIFCLKYISKISQHTLGIYVFSVYFLNEFIKSMTFLHYNFFIVLIEALIITVLSVKTMIYMEKNRCLNILLLGGR